MVIKVMMKIVAIGGVSNAIHRLRQMHRLAHRFMILTSNAGLIHTLSHQRKKMNATKNTSKKNSNNSLSKLQFKTLLAISMVSKTMLKPLLQESMKRSR